MRNRLVRASPPGTLAILLVSCLVLASVSVIAVVLRNFLDFCAAHI